MADLYKKALKNAQKKTDDFYNFYNPTIGKTLATKSTKSTSPSTKKSENGTKSTNSSTKKTLTKRKGQTNNKHKLSEGAKKIQQEAIKTNAVPQALVRFNEKVINDVALAPVSIPYQIKTGKKLADFGLEPTTKSAKKGATVGSVAGDIVSYASGYGAAGKATTKAAGKVLATKTGKKAVEKAAASKLGKKVGKEAVEKAAKSATKSAIADATVGTTLNLSHARGEGKEGKELAKDMAINAALDFGIGGVSEALPLVAKALKNTKLGKSVASAGKTVDNAGGAVKATADTAPTQKVAENGKQRLKTATSAENSAQLKDKQKAARIAKSKERQTQQAKLWQRSKEAGEYLDTVRATNKKAIKRSGTGIEALQSDKGFNAYMADIYGDIYAIENRAKKNGKTLNQFINEEYDIYRFVPDDIKNNYAQSDISIKDLNAKKGEIAENERSQFANYLQKKYGPLSNAQAAARKKNMDLQDFFRAEKAEFDKAKANSTTSEKILPTKETPRVESKNSVLTKRELPKESDNLPKASDNLSDASKPIESNTAQNNVAPPIKEAAEEVKVSPSGKETKVAGFDVEGEQLGILSPEFKTIEEAMETATGKFDKAYKYTVNAQREIDKLSKVAGDSRAANSVQAARASRGTAEYMFSNHLVNSKGEIIDDKSFKDVFLPVSKNSELFNEYAQNLNNISRWAQDKPLDVNVSAADSQARVDEILKEHPEFAEMTETINEYWQKFTHAWLVDTGRMTENAWQAMVAKYPNYVPAFMPNKGVKIGGSKFAINAGTKAAKAGSTLKRVPIEDAMMEQMQQIVRTSRKNDVYTNIIDTLRNDPDNLKHFGVVSVNKQPMTSLDLDDFMTLSEQESLKQVSSKVYTISAMENGQKVTAYINKDLADALGRIDNVIASPIAQAAADAGKKLTNPLKAGITGYNPIFAIANASRDIPTAIIQSEYGMFKTTKNMFRAIGEMATNGEMWQKYLAMGGKSSGYIGAHKGFEKAVKMSKNPIRNVWEGMKTVLGAAGEATESIPRLAEFISSMEKYGDVSRALSESAEVTVNFSRAGAATKTLDAWTLYLNAAVQGIDKFFRTVKEHPIRSVARTAAVVTTPYALLMAYNWDNPHYQDLNDRTKQNYFCIPNLAGEFDEQGYAKTFIKIPLNREYGTIFASSLDVVAGYMSGEANPWNGYWDTVKENFLPPNPIKDNVLAPLVINLPTNKDFAGRSIVPAYLEDVSPKLQSDYSTSGLAKGIATAAKNLGIPSETLQSPMKVDYLIDSYGGYLGQVGQAATDQGLQGTGERIKGSTIDPFIDRFTADPRFSSGVVSDFYDQADEAERAWNDKKLLGGEKDETYIKNKSYSSTKQALSDLSKEEREILSNNTLSAKQKDAKVKALREQKNEVARGASKAAETALSEYRANPKYTLLTEQQKESYEKNFKDSGISKKEYAEAKEIVKDIDTSAGQAYALASSGMSKDKVALFTSKSAYEKACNLKRAGATKQDIIKAAKTLSESGYTKSVGKAYALLNSGQSKAFVTAYVSDSAVRKAYAIRRAGITPEQLDIVAEKIDADGNGYYKNDELTAYLSGANMTQAQKHAVFEALKSSSKTANPY